MIYPDCCSLPQRREPLLTQPQMGSFSLLSPFSLLSSAVQMGSKSLCGALRIFCKAHQGRGINCEDDYSALRWVSQPCPEELIIPLPFRRTQGVWLERWQLVQGEGVWQPQGPPSTTPSLGEGALNLPRCARAGASPCPPALLTLKTGA